MRLIDADKLIKDIKQLWDYKTVDDITATTVLKQTITDIENQPTVKAIPIEWIEKWLEAQERIVLISPPYYNQVRVPKMLEDWEKENAL